MVIDSGQVRLHKVFPFVLQTRIQFEPGVARNVGDKVPGPVVPTIAVPTNLRHRQRRRRRRVHQPL